MMVYGVDKKRVFVQQIRRDNYRYITNNREKENNNKEEDTIHRR